MVVEANISNHKAKVAMVILAAAAAAAAALTVVEGFNELPGNKA